MQRALLSASSRSRSRISQSQEPAAGEARVAIDACGICGSDLHMYDGSHPDSCGRRW